MEKANRMAFVYPFPSPLAAVCYFPEGSSAN